MRQLDVDQAAAGLSREPREDAADTPSSAKALKARSARSRPLRVGLVGAGYIAPWHAEAIRANGSSRIVAVCDRSPEAAQLLASTWGAAAFVSLQEMLEAGECDVAHVLTPPQTHREVAIACMERGLHVLVEKPFALSRAEVAEVRRKAEATGRIAAVNHNFLALPSYLRLKKALREGRIGKVDSLELNWRHPLPPLRSGPYGIWPLREPRNILLEFGPHLYAFAHDLLGPLSDLRLDLGKPIALPGGGIRPQAWRIWARAGAAEVTLNLSLVEGVDDRSLILRGVSGRARLDYARDTLVIERANAAGIIVSPLLDEMSLARQHLREGFANAWRQLVSLNRRSPYALGFHGTVAAFNDAVLTGSALDPRFSVHSAEAVIGAVEDTLDLLPRPEEPAVCVFKTEPEMKETALVIGGTGFIGRSLTRALTASGRRVRVLSRGGFNPFRDLGSRVEMVSASLDDAEGLRRAMAGVEAVFHLAKAEEASWDAYLRNDVEVVERVARAALEAGARRFVYTGTIASYDASDPARAIDEETGFGDRMEDRNLYARSKALCERRLAALRDSAGLPLVIARPGVVVGAGGPLQHWGLGRWHGPGAVKIWNDGQNVVPFVLVEDVADALVKMIEVDEAVGRSFNLVGEPMLSARDYFQAIGDRLGTDINVRSGSPRVFYLTDWVKYVLKRHALGRRGLARPSFRDWQSRGHVSPFRNDLAKRVLGWRPEDDRDAFLRRAVEEANLFGF